MITIQDKSYEFKYSLRAMFVFESITDKPFEVKTLFDTYVFCYSCLVSNPDNPTLDFNDFIDWCEKYPEVMEEFNKFIEAQTKVKETVSPKKKAGRPKKI